MIKKVLYLMIIIVLGTLIADYVLVMRYDKDPWFTFKKEDVSSYGFIYEIKFLEDKKEFYIFHFKVDEKTFVKNISFEIIDKTEDVCPDGKYVFYKDEEYQYYFDCMKDYYILIGKVEYSLKNALDNDLIAIHHLEEKGLDFKKEAL